MKTFPTWMTAAVLGVSMTAAPVAFGQADLQLQQARQKEREARQQEQAARKADQAQNRQEQQANRQERRQERREREQLGNMPDPVRKVLRAETQQAQNVDYFREKGEGGAPPTFGARFARADGHQMVIRVDRQGNVISREDETAAQQASAQVPGQSAPQKPAPAQPAPTPAPTPAPAPGQPAPTPAPARTETTRSERGDVPHSSDDFYRELRPDEVPAHIRPVFDKETAGGKDVKYYRTKYGNEIAYEVKWTPAKGEDQVLYVNERGQAIVRRAESAQPGRDRNESEARTASSKERASSRSNEGDDAGIQTGRAQLNDLPRPVQTKFRTMTENAKDVEFYKTKYGKQQAYSASFNSRDGKRTSIYLDDQGNVLSHKVDGKQVGQQESKNR